MTLLTRSAFALLAMGLLCSPSRIQAAQKKTSPAAVQAAREHQAEAYQARLRMVRARLRARLPKQAAPAEPPLRAEPASDPAPALAPRQHCPPARPACFRAATPAPSHMGLLRFLFLALTLFNLFPCTGADLLRPLPDPGPPMPEAHARYAADQTARFNATFGLTLAQSPRLPVTGLAPAGTAAADFGTAPAAPPASAPATLGELLELAGPGSVGELNVRLARFRQWTAQARAATAGGPGEPAPFPLALNSQLAALDNLSLGMQLATTGYLARILSPAEAIASLSLASDTLLNVVNSFRVAAQGRTLDLFPPALAQLGSQLNETRAGLREDQLRAARDQALPAASTPPEDAPGPVRPDRQRKACCEVADLVDQLGIHRVIGASGAANVAAYLVATEAAAGIAGVDLLSARNRSLPAPLLAAADMGAATAVGLGSVVLGDPPPAAGTPDGAPQADATGSLADRCARFRCENAITQVQAQVAGETLAGSIMNLVGYILYSSAAQLTLAMEAESVATAASAPAPLNGTGGAAWTEGLMRQFRRQARAILPAGSGPALLATVPGVAAPAAAAFAGIAPGQGDGATFQAVMGVVTRALQETRLPSSPGAESLSGFLAGLHQLVSAGQELRGLAAAGTRTAASAAQWQGYSSLVACSRYALAATNGSRLGIIDPGSAGAVLKAIADTLQALVYGWLAEASAVPLAVARSYERSAVPQLARARARALGQDPPAAGQARTCLDCCRLAELQNLEAAQEVTLDATRTYLAAYTEALAGSAISETLDLIAAARLASPVRNAPRTGPAATGAVTAQATGAGASAPAPAAAGVPAGVPAADPPPAAACAACPCELSFSLAQLGFAEEIRSGAGLAQVAYTLNLVVKAFRIALAAGT